MEEIRLTPDGLKQLESRLEFLKNMRRREIAQELQEALLEYGKRNEASDALIVVSNSHCIIPCVSPMPSVTWLMTPDNGRFTMIAPNPIGRSKLGSMSFLIAR